MNNMERFMQAGWWTVRREALEKAIKGMPTEPALDLIQGVYGEDDNLLDRDEAKDIFWRITRGRPLR